MATVTRETIGNLTDKLTVKVAKEDYLPAFENSLKKYAKTANISGFRKGMVPASLVKKMYGQGVFSDEVLRLVEKQLQDYMVQEHLDIFAQPLPEGVEQRIARISKAVYRALRIRGYGRIDLRLTPENEVVILEANPNPNLDRDDEFAQSAIKGGLSYERLTQRILNLALQAAQ